MNILVLASEYPHEKDRNADRTKVVGSFARAWVKQGHRVVVIVNSTKFPAPYYFVGNRLKSLTSRSFDVSQTPDTLWTKRFGYDDFGVAVENLPIKKYIPHGRFSAAALKKQTDAIIDILDSSGFRPDVVTGHWVNPQLMLVPELARHYGARSAFVFHADYTESICKKFDVPKYIKEIDRVCFRSRSASQEAKRYLPVSEEPFVAASGIPDSFIEKYRELPERCFDEEKLRLITAARLVEYKKIDTIIEASAELFGSADFELDIAGDGPQRVNLEALAKSRGVSGNVHLLGQLQREELQERMRESDVFVLISKRETFGLVYIEAMLHGCIVIASKYGGVDGIIEDSRNGFLCEEGNKSALIQTLKKVKSMSAAERRQMSDAAHETALRYSDTLAARRYLDYISGNGAPADD